MDSSLDVELVQQFGIHKLDLFPSQLSVQPGVGFALPEHLAEECAPSWAVTSAEWRNENDQSHLLRTHNCFSHPFVHVGCKALIVDEDHSS